MTEVASTVEVGTASVRGWLDVEAANQGGSSTMYDEQTDDGPLSHEPPCVRCGHAAHTFLPCGNECDCQPTLMPGEERLSRR